MNDNITKNSTVARSVNAHILTTSKEGIICGF
jgi:hypothetical protein